MWKCVRVRVRFCTLSSTASPVGTRQGERYSFSGWKSATRYDATKVFAVKTSCGEGERRVGVGKDVDGGQEGFSQREAAQQARLSAFPRLLQANDN